MTSAKKMQQVDLSGLDMDQTAPQQPDFVFASHQGRALPGNHEDIEHIRDFAPDVDQLDLSDVAIRLKKTADETRAALCCLPSGNGTLLAILIDGAEHPLVMIHGVPPKALEAASPWVFDDLGTIPANTDAPLMLRPEDTYQPQDALPTLVLDNRLNTYDAAYLEKPIGSTTVAADAFVFDAAATLAAPSRPAKAGKRMEISQLAEALGVSEMQILETIRVDDATTAPDAAAVASEIETIDLTTVEPLVL